jgi:hypothetical protein
MSGAYVPADIAVEMAPQNLPEAIEITGCFRIYPKMPINVCCKSRKLNDAENLAKADF